jgi:hypothetical protein
MDSRLITGLLAIGLLGGCVSYRLAPGERGVSFPLQSCNSEVLARARVNASAEPDGRTSKFSSSWVCVTKPAPAKTPHPDEMSQPEKMTNMRLEAQAFSGEEKILRDTLESIFTSKTGNRPALGIALSGGGSKASSFGIGVLAGLADQDLLDSADFISSVSGGSYAAYFYYAHRIFPVTRENDHAGPVPSTEDLFRDCIMLIDANALEGDVRKAAERHGICLPNTLRYSTAPRNGGTNKYQAFLRCQQDLFSPGVCSTKRTSEDFGIAPFALLGTVPAVPISLVTNTLFDTGVNNSPSAHTYRDGIGVAYGATIIDVNALKYAEGGKSFKITCDANKDGYATDCSNNRFDVVPMDMTFPELRSGLLKLKKKSEVPFWVINAAAPKSRSGLGWWAFGEEDTTNSDMFEMTAVSHGSGRYGYVSAPVSLHDMTVVDAVASSAAFMDANQLVYKSPIKRGVIGAGLHLAAMDWGIDIQNYNVSDSRFALHRWLPIPFYWTDGAYARYMTGASNSSETQDRVRSSFIRLIDGGNGENLGVYSLVKRDVRNIILADAASDPDGNFADLCALDTRLRIGELGHVAIPGLKNFKAHCDGKDKNKGYDIHRWPFYFPVLVGCIRSYGQTDNDNSCENLSHLETRLLVVKPAINLPAFRTRQLEGAHIISCGVSQAETKETGSRIPLLNCDAAALLQNSWKPKRSGCQVFPQNSTVWMTANSSLTLFSAYRELARQYTSQAGELIRNLKNGSVKGEQLFYALARQQAAAQFKSVSTVCDL